MNRHIKKIISIFKYPKKEVQHTIGNINECISKDYIVLYNPECIGATNSIKELFDKKTVELKELFNKKAVYNIAKAIVDNGFKQVIFAVNAYGYKELAENIYELNKNIKIKFLWHGSHSLFVNRDEEYFLDSILDLQKRNVVTSIGFLKESMAEFYKRKGYNSYFVKNTVKSIKYLKDNTKQKNSRNDDIIKVGLYAAGDRWEKNTYNQLSAISLVKGNVVVDCIPYTNLTKEYCKLMNIKVSDECDIISLAREELIRRMENNTVNLYVTFSECAPLIPLESLEVQVPCIVGDNNHYFTNTKLENYLVVKSEDSIDEIAEKINLCVENRDTIIELYNEWKKDYDIESKKSVESFIKGDD